MRHHLQKKYNNDDDNSNNYREACNTAGRKYQEYQRIKLGKIHVAGHQKPRILADRQSATAENTSGGKHQEYQEYQWIFQEICAPKPLILPAENTGD